MGWRVEFAEIWVRYTRALLILQRSTLRGHRVGCAAMSRRTYTSDSMTFNTSIKPSYYVRWNDDRGHDGARCNNVV